MKRRMSLLPGMAVNNIRKNGKTYFPYIGVSVFAMFTYFVFDLILKSKVILTVPKAAYASALVTVGFWLLGIIMVPFLYYTNSFLIKRRKRELGLYSILGMEKKHIGVMMFWESLILYGIVIVAAAALGLLFSRLVFLLLLNLARLPVDSDFGINPGAFFDMLVFYGVVTGLNLFVNLIQVGKARPVELMSESQKGEKEPKHIWLWSLVGAALLGEGYYISLTVKLNGDIFTKFFFAVLLVVLGTYFLFTSGSVALLRFLKRRKKFYYRTENFITVSGMLYRMKKSAASLSNICIFATMVIITMICTIGVGMSMDFITMLTYPKSCVATFLGEPDEEQLQAQLRNAARDTGVELADYLEYSRVETVAFLEGNLLRQRREADVTTYYNTFDVDLMDLAAFNRTEGSDIQLALGEVLVYSTGACFGSGKIRLEDEEYIVKEELAQCSIYQKAEGDIYYTRYLVVLPDREAVIRTAEAFGVDGTTNRIFRIAANPQGEEEAVDAFFQRGAALFQDREGFAGFKDYRADRIEQQSMYGSLLFIGIFFGLTFLICLLVILYYKQITEGFEDQKNFEVMQKVGMSDEEIRRTIKKQILLVFALPLAGAVLHAVVGMQLVIALLAAIRCVNVPLLKGCCLAVCAGFAVLYSLCYRRTSAAYYRIVKKMG